MNACETLRDDLKAYMDGALPRGASLRLRRHLARCAACRQEVAAMERISKELRAADAGGLDPALRAKLLAVFPENAAPVPTSSGSKWGLRSMQTWATVAGVLLICVVCYPLFQHTREAASPSSSGEANPSLARSAPSAPNAGGGVDREFKNEQASPGERMASAPVPSGAAGSPAAPPAANAPSGKGSVGFSAGGNAGSFGASGSSRNFQSGSTGSFGGRSGGGKGNSTSSFGGERPTSKGGSFGSPSPSPKKDYGTKPLEENTADNTMAQVAKSKPSAPALISHNKHRTALPDVEKRVNLLLEVEGLTAKSAQVERMIQDVNGTVVRKQPATGEGSKATTWTLQIPVKRLEAFLDQAAQLGEVKARNVVHEDSAPQRKEPERKMRALHDEVKAKKAQAKLSSKQRANTATVMLRLRETRK